MEIGTLVEALMQNLTRLRSEPHRHPEIEAVTDSSTVIEFILDVEPRVSVRWLVMCEGSYYLCLGERYIVLM